jgi:hypothetical protein
MATKIKGQNEVLEVWDGTSTYEPMVCLISHTLSENVDEISSRTKCDANGATTKEAGAYTYEISFEGEYAETEAGKASWAELRTKLRSLGTFDWRITTTYADASTDIEYGSGFFSNLEKTAGTDEFISFSGSLIGSGLITATDPNA